MQTHSRIALVTGGTRGIGFETVRQLAEAGVHTLLAGRNRAKAVDAALQLQAKGLPVEALALDVTDAGSIAAAVAEVTRKHGRLDILVNNAGISVINRFVDTQLDDWERVLKVNLTGTFLCGQAAARAMVQQGSGRIINIASLSGQKGGTGRAAYGASKAGAELLMKVMAVELAEQGINVNAIAPGPIDTEMCRIGHSKETREAYHNLVPQRRYGTEQEIADAAVFLASDEARYVNGHTLNVDGGFLSAGLMFKLNERLG